MNNILSKFLEVEKSGTFTAWTPELEAETITRYIKTLQKGMEQMKEGPIMDGYKVEIAMLSEFLPKLMSEEDTRALMTPMKDNFKAMGPFVGAVMKSHKGKVDPELVRKIAAELGF